MCLDIRPLHPVFAAEHMASINRRFEVLGRHDPHRNGLKNSRISFASASGCSSAAKWPPFCITVQR